MILKLRTIFFFLNKEGVTKVLVLSMAVTTVALSKTQKHKYFTPGTG
jgi:hypothetical protein